MGIKIDLKREQIKTRFDHKIEKSQLALDTQVAKDSNYFCPEDTGTLQRSVLTGSKLGSGVLNWDQEYAKPLYYGEGFKFSKDRNPNASAKWFERAKAQYKRAWEALAKIAFKRG